MAPNSPVPESDLTAAQFDALLRRLDTDRNRAGEKYEEVRWKLVRFFQWNSCLAAEELVDETLNRVAERVAERGDEISDVAAFAWGVARKVRLEALRKARGPEEGFENCAPPRFAGGGQFCCNGRGLDRHKTRTG